MKGDDRFGPRVEDFDSTIDDHVHAHVRRARGPKLVALRVTLALAEPLQCLDLRRSQRRKCVLFLLLSRDFAHGDLLTLCAKANPHALSAINSRVKAIWKGHTIAESDDTVVMDGNHYFPPESLHKEHFRDSETHTVCGWKGVASYKSIVVDGEENPDAAWYYPSPKDEAKEIEGRFAFWKGVEVTY
ncbi:DUF427 domain-containing protein [bacterium]|nr:MAG: DUF427 domain-containing protein [bacterium]